MIEVVPSELEEVISETPAMWPNCRSSGVATDDAMIWALAPGSDAPTEIVGKSTWGRGETGVPSEFSSEWEREREPENLSPRLSKKM